MPATKVRLPGPLSSAFELPALWPARDPDRVAVPPEILAAIAAGLAFSPTTEAVELTGEGTRRFARLLQTAAYDAWLIAWAPAADLDLHDHGGSEGAFHVVRGQLIEAYSDRIGREPLRTLQLGPEETRRVTATRVHRVWNPGPAQALSVHVYSPPLTSMTIYDDRPDHFLTPLRTQPVDDAPEASS